MWTTSGYRTAPPSGSLPSLVFLSPAACGISVAVWSFGEKVQRFRRLVNLAFQLRNSHLFNYQRAHIVRFPLSFHLPNVSFRFCWKMFTRCANSLGLYHNNINNNNSACCAASPKRSCLPSVEKPEDAVSSIRMMHL